jgi:hypothetical protein
MPDEKQEMSDAMNSAMGLSGDSRVDWTKLSMREMACVYGYITGRKIRTGGVSESKVGGRMRDELSKVLDGMNQDEIDLLMKIADKRRQSLQGFPLLARAADRFLGEQKPPEKA